MSNVLISIGLVLVLGIICVLLARGIASDVSKRGIRKRDQDKIAEEEGRDSQEEN